MNDLKDQIELYFIRKWPVIKLALKDFLFNKKALLLLGGLLLYFVMAGSLNKVLLSRLFPRENKASSINKEITYLSKTTFNKKVFVLVFDPLIEANRSLGNSSPMKLSEYLKNKGLIWNDPLSLTTKLIDVFKTVSNNRLTYSIYRDNIITDDAFPQNIKGGHYDIFTYLECIAEKDYREGSNFASKCKNETDYQKIIEKYDLCTLVNEGKIDEIWIWGYSWMNLGESALIGANAFAYNGPLIKKTTCNKLVPVMGLNLSRDLGDALHSFGHRMESTLTHIYGISGIWKENRMLNRWEKFALTKAQSPNYNYSGIGTVHYAPNSEHSYQYDNTTPVQSFFSIFKTFDIFNSKEILNVNNNVMKLVDKNDWNCAAKRTNSCQLNYLQWWFSNIPQFQGVGYDNVLNDWIALFADPNLALKYVVQKPIQTDAELQCYTKPDFKWFPECGVCAKSYDDLASVCRGYCSQFNKDEKACLMSQDDGAGCTWYKDCQICAQWGSSFEKVCPCFCGYLKTKQTCESERGIKNKCEWKDNICQNAIITDTSGCTGQPEDVCNKFDRDENKCINSEEAKDHRCVWYDCSSRCYTDGTLTDIACYLTPTPPPPTSTSTPPTSTPAPDYGFIHDPNKNILMDKPFSWSNVFSVNDGNIDKGETVWVYDNQRIWFDTVYSYQLNKIIFKIRILPDSKVKTGAVTMVGYNEKHEQVYHIEKINIESAKVVEILPPQGSIRYLEIILHSNSFDSIHVSIDEIAAFGDKKTDKSTCIIRQQVNGKCEEGCSSNNECYTGGCFAMKGSNECIYCKPNFWGGTLEWKGTYNTIFCDSMNYQRQ